MTEFIIRFRWVIITACLLLGAIFGALIPMAETDPEIRNYVSQDMRSRMATDEIEHEFGVQDMVVILFSDSSVLAPENLNQIKDIDRAISRLKGVLSRISPFTMKSIIGEDGMIVSDPLIKKIPSDTSDTEELRKSINSNRFARDIVFSSDF
ncbi:MAG: hypothetical protein C0408_06880, partial [Odoribacter sp.]|nr:hypothetical protein [Odoribacter sp.]